MFRIRELLDELPGDTLAALCEKRGFSVPRALHERRSKLARSYRGDVEEFVSDLRKSDLVALFGNAFMFGPLAYHLVGASGMSKEQLQRIAIRVFSDEVPPPELTRAQQYDEVVDVERVPGHLDAVLRSLPRHVLVELADYLGLSRHGTARNIADRIARTEARDLVDFISQTFSRTYWNDVVESLGGSRRKSFEDLATELRILASDDDGDDAATTETSESGGRPAPGAAEEVAPPPVSNTPPPRLPEARVTLITDHDRLVATFERLAAWCERFAFVAPTLDTDRGRNRMWDAVRRHSSKLEPSFVGVGTASGDPIAMRMLYKLGKLRLLPTLDASMQCHAWRFENGNETAVLLLSGPFGAASLVAPLVSATLLEGARDADFAISIAGLYEQARAAAYVPDPDFDVCYSGTLSELRPSLDRMHQVVTAAFLRPNAAIVHGSTLVRGTGGGPSPREAVLLLQQVFNDHASRVEDQAFAGSDRRFTVLWLPALSLWARFQDIHDGMACTFGTVPPLDGRPLEPVCRFECAFDDDHTASLSIREDESRRCFFVVNADTERVEVLAPVGGRTMLRHLAAYVHDVARRSALASGAQGEPT